MTQFEYFWKRGYRALLPVVPGDDTMRNAGKRPGEWSPSGYWYGTGVQTYVATEELIDKWASWPKPGVGLRTHKDYVPIDIDSLASAFVDRAKAIALEVFGELGAERIGNAPKSLLLYQTYDTVPYQNYRFDDGTENGGLIEMQGGVSNKFIVVQGKHPKGMKYHWTAGDVPERAALPYATAVQVDEFFRRIKAEFPKAKGSSISAAIDREKVDQPGLKCPPEKIDALVAGLKLLPNTRATFGGYDKWVVAAAACRGAFQDDEHLGCDVFCELSERTDIADLTEDPEHIYWSLDPPFAFGYPYLRSLITQSNETGAAAGELWCEPIADEPTPASDVAGLFDTPPAEPPPGIKWVRPLEWAGQKPKPREWEVEGWIPKGEVTLLYGDGGIGKTLIIHQYATAAAAGRAWLGQPTRRAKIMCFFCEDSEDELLRRQIDINHSLGVTFEDTDEHLRIASRKYLDNLFILWDRNTGAMKRQAVWEQLKNDALAFGADVLIVDTIADTFGGNEIDRGQVNAFIKSCLGRLASEINGSVLALGHPSLSGKASGAGTSGSTAWSNAVRSRLYLRYPKGIEKGNVRELEGMKLNYGPKGNLLKLRWHKGAFDVVAASTAPVESDGVGKADAIPPTIEGAADDVVFAAVQSCLGVALNLKANSPHFAPKVLRRHEPDLLGDLGNEEIEDAIGRLEVRGAIRAGEVGRDSYRRPIQGYVAVRLEGNSPASVFE